MYAVNVRVFRLFVVSRVLQHTTVANSHERMRQLSVSDKTISVLYDFERLPVCIINVIVYRRYRLYDSITNRLY